MADAGAATDEPDDDEDGNCLHCWLGEAIDVFYREYGGGVVDLNETISHLTRLLADLVTLLPPTDRDAVLKDVSSEMRRQVDEYTFGTEAKQ